MLKKIFEKKSLLEKIYQEEETEKKQSLKNKINLNKFDYLKPRTNKTSFNSMSDSHPITRSISKDSAMEIDKINYINNRKSGINNLNNNIKKNSILKNNTSQGNINYDESMSRFNKKSILAIEKKPKTFKEKTHLVYFKSNENISTPIQKTQTPLFSEPYDQDYKIIKKNRIMKGLPVIDYTKESQKLKINLIKEKFKESILSTNLEKAKIKIEPPKYDLLRKIQSLKTRDRREKILAKRNKKFLSMNIINLSKNNTTINSEENQFKSEIKLKRVNTLKNIIFNVLERNINYKSKIKYSRLKKKIDYDANINIKNSLIKIKRNYVENNKIENQKKTK